MDNLNKIEFQESRNTKGKKNEDLIALKTDVLENNINIDELASTLMDFFNIKSPGIKNELGNLLSNIGFTYKDSLELDSLMEEKVINSELSEKLKRIFEFLMSKLDLKRLRRQKIEARKDFIVNDISKNANFRPEILKSLRQRPIELLENYYSQFKFISSVRKLFEDLGIDKSARSDIDIIRGKKNMLDQYFNKMLNGYILAEQDFEFVQELMHFLLSEMRDKEEFKENRNFVVNFAFENMIPGAATYTSVEEGRGLTTESLLDDTVTAISYLGLGAAKLLKVRGALSLRKLQIARAILIANTAGTSYQVAKNAKNIYEYIQDPSIKLDLAVMSCIIGAIGVAAGRKNINKANQYLSAIPIST